MKKLKLLIILPLILFMSCSDKETEIYRLDNFTEEKIIQDEYFITEVFIIRNPPEKNEELICLLKHFNDSTLILEEGGFKRASWFREFYRETSVLNKDFKEVGRKDLSFYYKDKIAICSFLKYKRLSGFYTIYLQSLIGETIRIEDLPHCNDFVIN